MVKKASGGGKGPRSSRAGGSSRASAKKAIVKGSAANAHASAGSNKRKLERQRLKKEKEKETRKKQDHGDEARMSTRMRLRTKVLERELERSAGTGTNVERSVKLKELARLQSEGGWTNKAIATYKELLKLMPEDPEMIRTNLLCLTVDQGRIDEAEKLLTGPLFTELLSTGTAGGEDMALGLATVTGKYSRALLAYISTRQLEKKKRREKALAKMVQKLEKYSKEAHAANPFVAEFIVFFPAFKRHFIAEEDLPEADVNNRIERLLLEAVTYCCIRGQVACWMDTDEDVRHTLREMLFEAEPEPGQEEKPPLEPLPAVSEGESPMLSTWRTARMEATDLWAQEMMADVAEDEEGEEEEPRERDDEEGGDSQDAAIADAEDRHLG